MDNTNDTLPAENAQLESGGGGMLAAPAPPINSPMWAGPPASQPAAPTQSTAPLAQGGGKPHPMAKLLDEHNGLKALTGGLQQATSGTPTAEHPVIAFGYPAHQGAYGVEVHAAEGHRGEQKLAASIIEDVFNIQAPAGSGWRVVSSYATAPEGEEGILCVTIIPEARPAPTTNAATTPVKEAI